MENIKISAKNIDELYKKLSELNGLEKQDVKVNVLEKPSKGFLGFGAKKGLYEVIKLVSEKPVSPKVDEIAPKKEDAIQSVETEEASVDDIDEVEAAKEFLNKIISNIGIDADINIKREDNLIKVDITGEEVSCLIGRRGETLDSIQFLTGLALNKLKKDSKTRIFINIENYREKREESLLRYCRKAARDVAKTRRTKKLDYMNPYERRIVHSALQNDKYVITYSEGNDPYRRVVIEHKNKRK